MKEEGITIVGPGAVGRAFIDLFVTLGYRISTVWDREKIHRTLDDGVKEQHSRVGKTISEEDLGMFVFLTVPDDRIKPVSMELAGFDVDWSRRFVIHCSGNLMSDECKALIERGASAASMHPIQTFTDGDGAERFREISLSLEGEATLTALLAEWIRSIGASPVYVDAEQKRKLHLAAVFACNYLVALLRQSEKLMEEAGIDGNLRLLKPLIDQTVENLFTKGVQNSLTGPISRGDIESVQKHIELLKKDPSLLRLYKLLGREALRITEKRGHLDAKAAAGMERALAVKNR